MASCADLEARFPATGPDGSALRLVVEKGGRAALRGRLGPDARAAYRVEGPESSAEGLELVVVCAGAGLEGARLMVEAARTDTQGDALSTDLPLGDHALRFRLGLPPIPLAGMRISCVTGGGTEASFLEIARMDLRARDRYGMERVEGGLDCSAEMLEGGLNSSFLNIPRDALGPGPLILSIDLQIGSPDAFLRVGPDRYPLRGADAGRSFLRVAIPTPRDLLLETRGGFEATRAFFVAKADLSAPLPCDPGASFLWSEASFRWKDRELFSWDALPEVLIIHFRDYAAQDRMLKRLAFFTEKAGFRGRLARDEEIQGLHGWNAHDYRPSSLAAFFSLAESEAFPLNRDELELLDILLENGIIARARGGYTGGMGAILSVARESGKALGLKLLGHEAFHGIYFTDEAYREACALAWKGLGAEARELLLAYFSFMEYDTSDADLMANELGSYLLQQPLGQLGSYLRSTMAARLSSSRRFGGSKDWHALARGAEADLLAAGRALEGLLASRWGLEAGRAWRLNPL